MKIRVFSVYQFFVALILLLVFGEIHCFGFSLNPKLKHDNKPLRIINTSKESLSATPGASNCWGVCNGSERKYVLRIKSGRNNNEESEQSMNLDAVPGGASAMSPLDSALSILRSETL